MQSNQSLVGPVMIDAEFGREDTVQSPATAIGRGLGPLDTKTDLRNRLDVVVMDRVKDLASKKAAVIFTKSSCYMCHSITQLFYELGASPAVHELDNEPYGREMERALRSLGCNPSVPAVFIGGKFVGSSKDVISLHVDGSLKQMLMAARAIWF
ncbi:glutaredoxin-c11-like protein [Trifolium pratense]|uniref:Glutaredoxin-c11-like protein n=5 Tax=Trifolieae TaxID=163742 RepID=A0A2K3N9B9_TRIPR|nr:glutaredoxin-c11-like protein [Trifolium pratense]